jgi:hypothetical protein
VRFVIALLVSAALVLFGSASWAYNCPVVIKQAEDTIKKAEAGKVSPETRPLKTAIAYAEEAIILQNP